MHGGGRYEWVGLQDPHRTETGRAVLCLGLYIGSCIRFHLIKKVLNLKIIALGQHTEA